MPENARHSFIVRLWAESREIADERPVWRGLVQHVLSGEQTYFQTFEEMVSFMKQLIESNINRIQDMEE
jgi:hypothetical protein